MKQNHFRARWHYALCTLAGAFAFSLAAHQAQATPLELIYSGSFTTQDALNLASQSTPTPFGHDTSFTIRAWFDTSTPDLAPSSPPAPPPFAGFRAFSPSLVTIDINGQTYTMDTIATDPSAGVTVAIFDQHSFSPGRYAVGILQEPPKDGAGIIGDFLGASPNFTANNITATTFTGFNGVGFGSGVCLQGTGANCQKNAVTPFVLHSGGQTFALTLGNYDQVFPGGADAGTPGITGPVNQAQLAATPEPGTLGIVGAALTFAFGLAYRRRS